MGPCSKRALSANSHVHRVSEREVRNQNYTAVILSPAVDKPVDDAPSTVTSVKGSLGSNHGNTQMKRTATTAASTTAQITTRSAVGPGRWCQIQAYI